jgi:chloramphenicol 3-O-phosphotransferase
MIELRVIIVAIKGRPEDDNEVNVDSCREYRTTLCRPLDLVAICDVYVVGLHASGRLQDRNSA